MREDEISRNLWNSNCAFILGYSSRDSKEREKRYYKGCSCPTLTNEQFKDPRILKGEKVTKGIIVDWGLAIKEGEVVWVAYHLDQAPYNQIDISLYFPRIIYYPSLHAPNI
jgi:hypothetical protein